jgi:hypothetical protein
VFDTSSLQILVNFAELVRGQTCHMYKTVVHRLDEEGFRVHVCHLLGYCGKTLLQSFCRGGQPAVLLASLHRR